MGLTADRSWSARLAALLCAALAVLPVPAFPWGAQGHEVVASIAQALLLPATRARVDAILAQEPGATLASISSWADQTRDRSTAAWHFINMPRGSDCVYVPARDCPSGRCVVAALTTQLRRLATSSDPAEQLEALKYVVHFVADAHQPLHAGFADDKGGNTYQLQAFGRGTNLHAVWDTLLLRGEGTSSMTMAGVQYSRPLRPEAMAFAPQEWVRESCLIASRSDFYPPGHVLTEDYVRTFRPVAEERLYLAGARLAATLNEALGGPLASTRR